MKRIVGSLIVMTFLSTTATGANRSGTFSEATKGETTKDERMRLISESPLVQEVQSPRPDLFRLAVVSSKDALAAIPALDALEASEGWRAVFLGSEEEMPEFSVLEQLESRSPADIIKQSESIDAKAFLRSRVTESSEGNSEDEAELLGEWPASNETESAFPERYVVLSGIGQEASPEKIYIALVMTDEAWKVPAFLQNGSWNDVPSPAEQVSVLRYWHEHYGARLRTFSRDVMELDVARPPTTREESVHLAYEQFGFCSDIVYQGVGELRPLAAGLQDSDYWYFWWD